MSLVGTTSLEIKGLEDLGKCPPIPDSDNYEKTVFLEGFKERCSDPLKSLSKICFLVQ